jgi:cell division transport system permease protein
MGLNMKSNENMSKITNIVNILKLLTIAFLCAFCVLVVGHYYKIKDYAISLSRDLNIVIFFNKNITTCEGLREKLEATGFISVKECVGTFEAYLKAVEKNPFLKDISVPGDAMSIQTYAIAIPKLIPDENFISKMRNTLEQISDIDEVVFDTLFFKKYVEIESLVMMYQKIFFIFGIIVLVLFILKCIFFIIECELNTRKFVINIFLYLLSSTFGFLAVYRYTQINDIIILLMIPFAAAFGVILD